MPRRVTALLAAGLVGCTVLMLGAWGHYVAQGGGSWVHGDWLINSGAGPVRRGQFGDLVLWLSAALGLGPLAVVVAVQTVALLVVLSATLGLALHLSRRPLYWLLFYNPGFCLVFWAANPLGSGRKELLAFAALALLPCAALLPRGGGALLAGALALFGLGLIGHEANALLFPAFAMALAVAAPAAGWSRRTILVVLGLLGGATLAAVIHAVTFLRVTDAAPMCAALVERGLPPGICDGAIRAMTTTGGEALGQTADQGWHAIPTQLGVQGLVLAPIGLVLWHHDRRPLTLGLLAATALPVLPLYGLGIDWGRWVTLHTVSFGALFLCLVVTGRVRLRHQPDRRLVLALVVASLLWAPSYFPGFRPWGVLGEAVETVRQLYF